MTTQVNLIGLHNNYCTTEGMVNLFVRLWCEVNFPLSTRDKFHLFTGYWQTNLSPLHRLSNNLNLVSGNVLQEVVTNIVQMHRPEIKGLSDALKKSLFTVCPQNLFITKWSWQINFFNYLASNCHCGSTFLPSFNLKCDLKGPKIFRKRVHGF